MYLRSNFEVSPDGELVENILKINTNQKITINANKEAKQSIVANILYIISDKGFHHNIVCFKKILKIINADDTKLMEFIKTFSVKNSQGCYLLINTIFNMQLSSDAFAEDFDVKREIIFWLDSSVAAKPKQNWRDKMYALQEKIGFSRLHLVCEKILENEHLKNHHFNDNVYWSDDVCKRFIKSAKWTQEHGLK